MILISPFFFLIRFIFYKLFKIKLFFVEKNVCKREKAIVSNFGSIFMLDFVKVRALQKFPAKISLVFTVLAIKNKNSRASEIIMKDNQSMEFRNFGWFIFISRFIAK